MRLSIPYPWNIKTIWVFLVFCSCFFPSLSFEDHLVCGTNNQTSDNFGHKVNEAMESLWELVSSQSWGTVFKNDPNYNIFGLVQCYQDASVDDCELCFKTSQEKLQQCIPARSGRVYLDQCFIRFDHYNFYNEGVDPKYDHISCGSPTGDSHDIYMSQDFQSKLDNVVLNVKAAALRKNGYAVTEVKGGVVTVYALAQCWKTIDKQACDKCLTDAGMRLRGCGPAAEGRALFTGCYMRYSTNRFFDHDLDTVQKKGKLCCPH